MSDQKQVEREINSPIPALLPADASERGPQVLTRRRFLQTLGGVGAAAVLAKNSLPQTVLAQEETEGAHLAPTERAVLYGKIDATKIYLRTERGIVEPGDANLSEYRDYMKELFGTIYDLEEPAYSEIANYVVQTNGQLITRFGVLTMAVELSKGGNIRPDAFPFFELLGTPDAFPRVITYTIASGIDRIRNVPPRSTAAMVIFLTVAERTRVDAERGRELMQPGINPSQTTKEILAHRSEVIKNLTEPEGSLRAGTTALGRVLDTYPNLGEKLEESGVVKTPVIEILNSDWQQSRNLPKDKADYFQLNIANKWFGFNLPDEVLTRLATQS